MAKWIGSQDLTPGSHPQSSPSAVDGPDRSQFADRSEFRTDRNIHKHAAPLGEDGPQEWQYRSKKESLNPYGPKLDRAIKRQTTYDDGTHGRFGAIGNGVDGDTNPAGKWNSRTGKSTEGITPGNAGRTGMGKSG